MQLVLDFPPAAIERQRGLTDTARRIGATLGKHAADRAERAADGWQEAARCYVLAYLRAHGQASGEDITDAAKQAGFVPPDDRAFGTVYATLARANRIAVAGYCARRKGHGTAGGRLWRLVR